MEKGPEFGGAIGLLCVLAQSMAVAMHLIGFCESLLDMIIEVLFHRLFVLNIMVGTFHFYFSTNLFE
jgi:hypothetical protein